MDTLRAFLVFGGAALIAAVIAALFESSLLKRRGWTDSARGWKFALAANGIGAALLGALVYLMITVVMLGALGGSRDAFAATVIPLLLLASPLLFFLLRLWLLRAFRVETGGRPAWRYAASSALFGWGFVLLVFLAAVGMASRVMG